MRIQELELSLGVKLFDRSHRTARLTPKGKELVFYAKQLVELTTEMQQRITPPTSLSGLIRVGVVEVIASTWLPRFIHALQEEHPSVQLELEVALTFELSEKLRTGGLDVVFALGRPPGTNYVVEPLGSIQLEWMAHPDLGLPAGTVSAQDLQRWPFITLNRLSYHHTTVEEWMKANKVRSRRTIICNSMTVAASLVAARIGISLLPPICHRREIEHGDLRVVRTSSKLQPVDLYGMYPVDEFQPLARLVTDLAARVSHETIAADAHDVPQDGMKRDGGVKRASTSRQKATTVASKAK